MTDQETPPPSVRRPKQFRTVLGAAGPFSRSQPEHFKRIGIICAEWAAFEARLDMTILVLAALDPKLGAAITSQITGPVPRLRVILSLLEIKGAAKSLRDKITEFMNKTNAVADERNRVVHDPWFYEHIEGHVEQRRSGRIKKSFIHEYSKVTIDDLDRIIKMIDDHHMHFMSIYIDIQDDPSRPFADMLRKEHL